MDDWEDVSATDATFVFPPKRTFKAEQGPSNTVVLVGRTGNGKSSTGNSILGSKQFNASWSLSSVTKTCDLKSAILPDGRTIRVIDTPGLFDESVANETTGQEIVKCITLASDGIHGILVVLSLRARFSQEEVSAVQKLQMMFGKRVLDYMIVVFTGGDEVPRDVSLEDYIRERAPQFLKDFVTSCGNRMVLFDNKTQDKKKQDKQLAQLLKLLDEMVTINSCIPYTNEFFEEAKKFRQLEQPGTAFEERLLKVERGLETKVDESALKKLKDEHEAALRKERELWEATLRETKERFERERQKQESELEALRKQREQMEQHFNIRSRCTIL